MKRQVSDNTTDPSVWGPSQAERFWLESINFRSVCVSSGGVGNSVQLSAGFSVCEYNLCCISASWNSICCSFVWLNYGHSDSNSNQILMSPVGKRKFFLGNWKLVKLLWRRERERRESFQLLLHSFQLLLWPNIQPLRIAAGWVCLVCHRGRPSFQCSNGWVICWRGR